MAAKIAPAAAVPAPIPGLGGASLAIRELFKIYGPAPERFLPAVREGISKDELRDVHGHVLGLRDINLQVAQGQILVVMGLSGSGKSTLIRHINRLIEPSAGQILAPFEGRVQDITQLDASALRRFRSQHTAMVFQRFALMPHLTVLENAAYGQKIRGQQTAVRHEHARRWIERVGLAGYGNQFPHQLSGGMQQRVGLARALAQDAPLLLMDEPFSALDPLIRHDMQGLLLSLQRDVRKTIVFITHDLDEALRLGDRIAILRDGELVQQGSAEQIVLQPASAYVSDFVAQIDRGKVLRCQALLRDGGPVAGPSWAATTRLEDATRQLNALNLSAANLVDDHGLHLGTVSLHDIIAAMLPERDSGVSRSRSAL